MIPEFFYPLNTNLIPARHGSIGRRGSGPRGVSGRLTFGVLRGSLPLRYALQADGDAQELHIAVAIPHQQLLLRQDFLAALVEYLPLTLDSRQILLLGEPGTVHQGHPVASGALAVDEVAQAPVFKDLESIQNWIRFDRFFPRTSHLHQPHHPHLAEPLLQAAGEGQPKASARPR